ncbi:MAG: D-2-hydroxyacid dehydrogenase [Deltaproteobacteria bacterium]|nr:D-2-hydroxyacid dehydrogenase [Deltaproteobacteria bacterium]
MKIALLYPPSDKHLLKLRLVAGGAELDVAADTPEDTLRAVTGADAILGKRRLAEVLPRFDHEGLRWVQTQTAGVEEFLPLLKDERTLLTSARGLYDTDVADHAVALWLSISRGLVGARDRQREQRWERPPHLTAPRTALVLGLGGIGAGIAKRVAACGLRVRGMRRRGPGLDTIDGVTTVVGQDGWRELLEMTGALFLALPLTRETEKIIGPRELKRLPPGAVIVNVARGGLLDEDALVAALREGKLGGAGLDTFATEPLPKESPLWTLPNVLVSPHLGNVFGPGTQPWEALFEQNLARFVRGEALANLVDRKRGY